VLLSQSFNSIVRFSSRKDDLIRQPEIGENVWNKLSFNYEWLLQVCKK